MTNTSRSTRGKRWIRTRPNGQPNTWRALSSQSHPGGSRVRQKPKKRKGNFFFFRKRLTLVSETKAQIPSTARRVREKRERERERESAQKLRFSPKRRGERDRELGLEEGSQKVGFSYRRYLFCLFRLRKYVFLFILFDTSSFSLWNYIPILSHLLSKSPISVCRIHC